MEHLAGRVILFWGWRRWLLAMLAGAVASFALTPFDFPAAGFVAFPVLVWLLDGAVVARGRPASFLSFFAVGWFFGFGYFVVGMGWLGTPFASIETALSFILAAIGVPAGLAAFYGLATLLARFLWSDGLGRIAALAFSFGIAEWLRITLLSGFAWNAIGYTAMPLPVFMQAVQVVGLVGMSAAAVFVFAAPALIGTRRQMVAGLVLAFALVVAQLSYGYVRLASDSGKADGGAIPVRLVKPSDAQTADFKTSFQAYRKLTTGPAQGNAPALVLWPENAVPFVLTERGELLTALEETVGTGQTLVLGTKRREVTGDKAVHDAVAVITDRGEIADAADKQNRLIPAGYTPFSKSLSALDLRTVMSIILGSSEEVSRLLRIDESRKALPLFGGEAVVPDIAGVVGADADIILNPADYGPFAGTFAPDQHLRQAQIRAVEAGRPLLLTMPRGITAAIDSKGRILGAMGLDNYGALDISLSATKENIVMRGNKFYVGLTFAVFFGMLALLLSIRDRLM